jgi:phosphoglycolate phosphatase
MLILFDVDATLISTSRAGIDALAEAGRTLIGPHFSTERVEIAGRLDPLILRDLLLAHDLEPTPERVAALRAGYRTNLPAALARPGRRCATLPGVPELLAALEARPRAALGLLTGNYEDTGSLKLRACGLEPARFGIRVWGDESPHSPPSRDHLPHVALERYERSHRRKLDPARAVIVGDTPHDVRCARGAGMRALAVATGVHDTAALSVTGADRVVSDLSQTAEILAWMLD